MFDVAFLSEIESIDTEDRIIEAIQDRAQKVFLNNSEAFYQFMYRIDISEMAIESFNKNHDFHSLAKVIWQRQKTKMRNWNSGEIK